MNRYEIFKKIIILLVFIGFLLSYSHKQILRGYIVQTNGHVFEVNEERGYVSVRYKLVDPYKRRYQYKYIVYYYNEFEEPYVGMSVKMK